MSPASYPLQILRFPILVQPNPAGAWQKWEIRATSWEMAMHRVAKDLKPGATFDIEECPYCAYCPRQN